MAAMIVSIVNCLIVGLPQFVSNDVAFKLINRKVSNDSTSAKNKFLVRFDPISLEDLLGGEHELIRPFQRFPEFGQLFLVDRDIVEVPALQIHQACDRRNVSALRTVECQKFQLLQACQRRQETDIRVAQRSFSPLPQFGQPGKVVSTVQEPNIGNPAEA
jgi:hypothetical protein